ncbi:MAG: DUF262 domain-containing protein [Nitrospirales bacterium]
MSNFGKIQNTIYTLETLFAVNTFRVPQYQRAYSWEDDPQLEAFLEDLRQQVSSHRKSPTKQYFLGTFLLHEEDIGGGRIVVNIVDGQQRMTTSIVFIATALALHSKGKIFFNDEKAPLLKRHFIYDEEQECQKFHTIQEDDPFFQSEILGISAAGCQQDSPSSRRLKSAANYFTTQVAPEEWELLIKALKTARVMVYAVESAEDATQIFELQNDRGKPLTNLEALKSFLMHCIYLHSLSRADDYLSSLQTQFSKIFRTIEALAECTRTPDEDQLLSNHCAAFLKWTEKEYNKPKHLVKATIKAMDGTSVIPWIQFFVNKLKESYKTIEELFDRRDELLEFSELLILGRMGPIWPLILKTWHYDKTKEKGHFRKTCRLLEVFTFRGYAIANLRADTNVSTFHTEARNFDGAFEGLFNRLSEMSYGHNLEERFVAGLDNATFYDEEQSDARYLLWRYENHLREQTGKIQPLLSWKDFVEPRKYAAKFSVEHIAAQNNPMTEKVVRWSENDPQLFKTVALNRLGNLVIDSVSPNASKGRKDFAGKLKSLSENSIYLSQGELIGFLKNPDALVWDVDAVRLRHNHLLTFAQKMWSPKTWHQF